MRFLILLLVLGCGGARGNPASAGPPDARPEPVAVSPEGCPVPAAGNGVVAGAVVDEKSGAGQAGIVVRVLERRVATTGQGTFHVCDVPAGQHRIGFSYGGVEVERPVTVTAGQVIEVKLTIQAVGAPPVKMQ